MKHLNPRLFALPLAVIGIVASLSLIMPRAVQADAPKINTKAANCFNSTTSPETYTATTCNKEMALDYGSPLKNGKCYTVNRFGPTTQPYNVKAVDCDKVITAADTTTTPTPAGGTPATTTSRDDSIKCDGTSGGKADQKKLQACLTSNPLVTRFNEILNFLGIGVGVIIVIMIIVGGIQYTTSGSNPQAVTAAKQKISNAVIAFVAFLLLYSFLQWILPGGVF